MYNDPTDVGNRKPQRLRGTPANKFTAIVAIGIAATFSLILHLYTSSEAEWVQANRRRVLARHKQSEEEIARREMFRDPLLTAVLTNKTYRLTPDILDNLKATKSLPDSSVPRL